MSATLIVKELGSTGEGGRAFTPRRTSFQLLWWAKGDLNPHVLADTGT